MKHRNSITIISQTRKFLPAILLSILTVNFFCIGKKELELENNSRNLKNKTTAFIYNAIPHDQQASISSDYSEAINTFSVKLLGKVYSDTKFNKKNVILSPFSVSRCLAALAEGSTGVSKKELVETLGGEAALDDARSALSELLYADNSVIFQCADAIWTDSVKYSINPVFKNNAKQKFGVQFAGLNFSNKKTTAATINNWISTNTDNNLSDVIIPEMIDPERALFFTNAVYFKADWASPFDITKTGQDIFHSPSGDVSTDMMSSNYLHKIRKTGIYENVRLYYGTTNTDYFYLDIYMPVSGSIESFLDSSCLSALSNNEPSDYGSLVMPKFFFKTDVDLIPMLKEMGLNQIFDLANMDFSEIVSYKNGNQLPPLYVNLIKHIAGIETSEEGTKAYTVTVMGITVGSAGSEEPENIILNKPFVYFIRAGENGLVLFAGVVNNPGMK